MSLSSVVKRKHPPPHSSRDSSLKRTRTSTSSLTVRTISSLFSSNPKFTTSVPRSSPSARRACHSSLVSVRNASSPIQGTTDTAPTESKNAHEDLRQVLKERLAVANKMLPTLLAELAMWNTKIQQAVDVKRKDQRLPFLDDEENGI